MKRSILPALLVVLIIVSCSKEKSGVQIRVSNETGHRLTDVVVVSYTGSGNSEALGKIVQYGAVNRGSKTLYHAHQKVASSPVIEFEMEGYGPQNIWIMCPIGMDYLTDGNYSLIVEFTNNYLSAHFQED